MSSEQGCETNHRQHIFSSDFLFFIVKDAGKKKMPSIIQNIVGKGAGKLTLG